MCLGAVVAPALALACAGAPAAVREVDLLAIGEPPSSAARRMFESTWRVTYRAEELPILELGLALAGEEALVVHGRVLWNLRDEVPDDPTSGAAVPPAVDRFPRRNVGSAPFRAHLWPGKETALHLDLRGASERVLFDGYRGWIDNLTVKLERPASNVRIARARLHPDGRSLRWRARMSSLADPARTHPNYLALATVLPMALVARRLGRSWRRAILDAMLVLWGLGALVHIVRQAGKVPPAIETIATVAPERLGRLRSGDGRAQAMARTLRELLPPRSDVSVFGTPTPEWERCLLGMALPLWTFRTLAPGREYEAHFDASRLASLVQWTGNAYWIEIARGRPLAQTFRVTKPVEAVALTILPGGDVPEGGILEVRIWHGAGKDELLARGTWARDRPMDLEPAPSLCPGETYKIELKLFNTEAPLRILAARGNPFPHGSLGGGAVAGNDSDLMWKLHVSPPGMIRIGRTGSGGFVFRKGRLEPCASPS